MVKDYEIIGDIKSDTQHYVLCISSEKYPASLEARKIYQCVPDTQAEAHGQIRVIDESGEDYLYTYGSLPSHRDSERSHTSIYTRVVKDM